MFFPRFDDRIPAVPATSSTITPLRRRHIRPCSRHLFPFPTPEGAVGCEGEAHDRRIRKSTNQKSPRVWPAPTSHSPAFVSTDFFELCLQSLKKSVETNAGEWQRAQPFEKNCMVSTRLAGAHAGQRQQAPWISASIRISLPNIYKPIETESETLYPTHHCSMP